MSVTLGIILISQTINTILISHIHVYYYILINKYLSNISIDSI